MRDIFPPNNNPDQFSEETLKLVSFCPVCHYRYNPIEAEILEQNEDANLLHVRCRRCHSTVLALVTMGQMGISSVGLVTDLSGAEVRRIKLAAPVSDTDLLNLHEFLGNNGLEKERLTW